MSWFTNKLWFGFFGVSSRGHGFLVAAAGLIAALHAVLVGGFVLVRLRGLNFVRLHYTATLGVDWVDAWWNALLFPCLGLAFMFVNGFFSGLLARRHRQYGVTIAFLTLIIESVLASGGVMAILLNA
ncbi:hypothetical protein A3C96_00660 [Candidatus Uhrbacteria bacterium RIFCSPHIGHO2_02_FULL_60_10]|uniref:Uncharacterized protein n=1 Tax=Candidatus Uhrbacteria bacterium RIFCSPHIGHO2_02_FULL_60_10 TaxID=1802392 RepID=A0A1F7U6Y4_9BACT|nr:MAG: hypothetical protein A3C96_00660 [Candidatus Uhrbacteria bacterium RIFCSPHIGHO2_02_FULL_60_10]